MADKKDAKKTTKSEKPELKASTIGFTKENNPNNLIQRTLIVFKPDAVQRGIVGEILSRFERVGLKIVGAKMVSPDKDHYYQHYEGISKMISYSFAQGNNVILYNYRHRTIVNRYIRSVKETASLFCLWYLLFLFFSLHTIFNRTKSRYSLRINSNSSNVRIPTNAMLLLC